MLPELVDKIQNHLLQSFAASCLAGIRATSDYRQPLNWIADTSSTALIALGNSPTTLESSTKEKLHPELYRTRVPLRPWTWQLCRTR